jgi:uncharacterized protein (DUF433 family)
MRRLWLKNLLKKDRSADSYSCVLDWSQLKIAIEGRRMLKRAHERIEINPAVMGGKPVIRGTRIPVELILRKLGAGMTAEAILVDHPRLAPEDIRAAQAFAADYISDEEVVYR